MKKVKKITIQTENCYVDYETSIFNAGEVHVKISDFDISVDTIFIRAKIENSEDLMTLVMITEALKVMTYAKLILFLPYLPYSRQDRICNTGEALSVKVFANIINSLEFTEVHTEDNHSDVGTALINNCYNKEVHDIFDNYPNLSKDFDFLVSPDAGANKKVQKISNKFMIPMIRADKTRELGTNKIKDTIVYTSKEEIQGKNVLIIDDICDGGRTFIELTQALQKFEPKSITLYVTHGIFAKGTKCLKDAGISRIICRNPWSNLSEDDLKRIEII